MRNCMLQQAAFFDCTRTTNFGSCWVLPRPITVNCGICLCCLSTFRVHLDPARPSCHGMSQCAFYRLFSARIGWGLLLLVSLSLLVSLLKALPVINGWRQNSIHGLLSWSVSFPNISNILKQLHFGVLFMNQITFEMKSIKVKTTKNQNNSFCYMQTCLTKVSRFWLTELRQGPMWPLSVRDFSKAWDFTKRLKGFGKKRTKKIRSESSEQRINEGKSVGVRLTNKENLGRRQNSRQTLRTRVKDIQTQTANLEGRAKMTQMTSNDTKVQSKSYENGTSSARRTKAGSKSQKFLRPSHC